ncbi:MAG: SDR family NAD(P)-dependent oxidoreductase [Bacteroidota bacterium]
MTRTSTLAGTALITGGSSGIGYAIACELAQRNYDLILVSNQREKLQAVCDELSHDYAIDARVVYMDLAQVDAATALYTTCQENQWQVDVLVNNAGMFFFDEVVKTPAEKAQTMLVLQTVTPALLCSLFGKDMKQRGFGYILNISSLAAYLPYPGIALYSSTKRFLKSFSRALRSEMLDYNVYVTCILPGAVSTDLLGLSDANHKKAIRFGIMMRADKLARLSVKALFGGKSTLMPGALNRITRAVLCVVPPGFVVWFRRHSGFLPVDKK